jgi:hypothetical protein
MGRPASCLCGECAKCKRRIYMRDWYAKNRERVLTQIADRRKAGSLAAYERERYNTDEQFRKRKKARNAVSIRLKRGTMKRQPCEVCGAPEGHAHHEDYDRPLDVRWLCETHHRAVHGERVAA